MPEYARKLLDRLHHTKPKSTKYDPHCWTVPDYGKIIQMAPYTDKSGITENKTTNRIQSIVGTF